MLKSAIIISFVSFAMKSKICIVRRILNDALEHVLCEINGILKLFATD